MSFEEIINEWNELEVSRDDSCYDWHESSGNDDRWNESYSDYGWDESYSQSQ